MPPIIIQQATDCGPPVHQQTIEKKLELFFQDSLRSWRQSVDVGQELRLGNTGVTHEADVDAAADLHSGRVLVDTADQEKQQSFLDVLVAVDFRCNGARKLLIEILLLSKQTKRGQKNFQIEHL